MSETLRGTACHEAGHATVATNEGYEVVSVFIWEVSTSDPKGKWKGVTNYAPKSFTCPDCGAAIEDAHDECQVGSLTDNCAPCETEKLRFSKRVMAGECATRELDPEDHDWDNSNEDRARLFRAYPNSDRGAILAARNEASTETIRKSKDAITEIQDLLIQRAKTAPRFEVVCVSGPEIRAIYQKHISNRSEQKDGAAETNVQLPM